MSDKIIELTEESLKELIHQTISCSVKSSITIMIECCKAISKNHTSYDLMFVQKYLEEYLKELEKSEVNRANENNEN